MSVLVQSLAREAQECPQTWGVLQTMIATVEVPALVDGIRETFRLELTEELQAHLTALLRQNAGTPPSEPVERLRAAGRDLVYLHGFAALLEHQSVDAELDQEGMILCAVAGGASRELDRLVRQLDQEVGLDRGRPCQLTGLRETYIAGVRSPEVRRALQRMLELAHAESISEMSPLHPLRDSIRGLAEELSNLASFLSQERAAIAQSVSQACQRIAGALLIATENAPTLGALSDIHIEALTKAGFDDEDTQEFAMRPKGVAE